MGRTVSSVAVKRDLLVGYGIQGLEGFAQLIRGLHTAAIVVVQVLPIAVFGAMLGLWLTGLFLPGYENNVFAQIGLVMLIGMAAKNAILIVEFAKMKSEEGMDRAFPEKQDVFGFGSHRQEVRSFSIRACSIERCGA